MAKTRITIMDIDLGIDVDTIITNAVVSLTGESKAKFDKAVELAKLEQQIKKEKETKKLEEENILINTLNSVMAAIHNGGDVGVPFAEVMEIAKTLATTKAGLTTRIKHRLIELGNKHVLKSFKVNGVSYYKFTEYQKLI